MDFVRQIEPIIYSIIIYVIILLLSFTVRSIVIFIFIVLSTIKKAIKPKNK